MLIRGRFEFPIILSLIYVSGLFDLLLLTCELTVLHILFLEMYKIFLICFLIDNVNTITLYFNFVNNSLNTIEIELVNLEDVRCHEHQASIYCVVNIMIELTNYLSLY